MNAYIFTIMRSLSIEKGNLYHVYNRGSLKQKLFYDDSDYARFLFLILFMQSGISLPHANRYVSNYLKSGNFDVKDKHLTDIIEDRSVELVNFCIMPNHFHLTVRPTSDDGLAKFMHKVGNSYSQYFNKRYDKAGHVFQGAYKAKLVIDDNQLAYLSAYIHRNPNELKRWEGNSINYPWSSYSDYKDNRWGDLLVGDEIMDTFKSFKDYSLFVEESGAKDIHL